MSLSLIIWIVAALPQSSLGANSVVRTKQQRQSETVSISAEGMLKSVVRKVPHAAVSGTHRVNPQNAKGPPVIQLSDDISAEWRTLLDTICRPRVHEGTDLCGNFPSPVHMPLFTGEFGNELPMIMPVAYFLHECGALASTMGCGNMSAYYWFSPKHTDVPNCKRSYHNADEETFVPTQGPDPRQYLTCWGELLNGYTPGAWSPPPFKEHYLQMPPLTSRKGFMNAPFQLAIVNKFESEWGHGPVNYLDVPTIRSLVELFGSTCGANARVLYSKSESAAPGESQDQQDQYQLMDHDSGQTDQEFIRSQHHVETIQDFYSSYPNLSANEIKLRTFARTQCIISTQGGSGHFAFLFGGINIVMQKKGRENARFYDGTASRLSGQKIHVVDNFAAVLKHFRELMLTGGCAACSKRKA